MRISKIEFENFRNFREHGSIDFPTDGTISIIYGMNGAGKTTLHQLFQWVFYGETNFSTASKNNLWNDPLESELNHGEEFRVYGCIYFEHPNENGILENYKVVRQWRYTKGLTQGKPRLKDKVLLLQKKNENDDWKLVDEEEKALNKILPKGLSTYFFFDGERMVADLDNKAKDTSKALKKAMFALFDLDIYDYAISDIGGVESSSGTLLGKLYAKKSEAIDSVEIVKSREKINRCKDNIAKISNTIEKINRTLEENKKKLSELSALIGNNQSRAGWESERKSAKKTIVTLQECITREQLAFGKNIYNVYPMLLMTKLIEQAKMRISLKAAEQHIPYGLERELLVSLINKEENCICGHHLGEHEKDELRELLKAFPPLSQTAAYDKFREDAARLSETLDPEELEKHITVILDAQNSISELRHRISEIDETLKQNEDVERLIIKRKELEEENVHKNRKIGEFNKELSLYIKTRDREMKNYDTLVKAKASSLKTRIQIEIMEAVQKKLKEELGFKSEEYSQRLKNIVQELLDSMTSEGFKVSIDNDFVLKVTNKHGNAYLSEGQRAVVTFAYIGGIFKMLRETEVLKNKEYPLVLDGPFSKLDENHIQKIVDYIPAYAPQIIILTFQDLTEYLPVVQSYNIWDLCSANKEQTICYATKRIN